MILIVMGVSGSGKSVIGTALADALSFPFFDADTFHPEENIEKMSAGTPLTDHDRVPWLLAIRKSIEEHLEEDKSAVIACSALKASYREILQRDDRRVKLIYLKGDFELIKSRLDARLDHFMPPGLLQSQFDTLEEPDNAWVLSIEDSKEAITHQILELMQN
ncbi:UNVERIFIED_CONTAM: hypothetical protein GTU68_031613 [Idotea baltica]|nr:hypothetical protein [Idotea baltica]